MKKNIVEKFMGKNVTLTVHSGNELVERKGRITKITENEVVLTNDDKVEICDVPLDVVEKLYCEE